MVTRLLLIFLCLGVLSTVPGCSVAFPSSGTSSSGGRTENETQPFWKPWGRQDGGPYHPWERPPVYGGGNVD